MRRMIHWLGRRAARAGSWIRRRVWWNDLTRDWRVSKPTPIPEGLTSSFRPGGKLILRRNTGRLRRNEGRRMARADGITLNYYYDGSQYAVQLNADFARKLTSPEDWFLQFPDRTVQVRDIVRLPERSANEPSVTVVLTADLSASRQATLSPDGVTTAVLHRTRPAREDVRAVYQEVAAAWRQLTDVRFKLLALIPVISGVGLFSLLDSDGTIASSPTWARAAAAAFGFLITVGLYVYDRRNSQLYNDLISRGKHLENAMGFTSGVFRGRLSSTSPINHSAALRIIYLGTLLAWLVVFVAIASGQLDHEPADRRPPQDVEPATE